MPRTFETRPDRAAPLAANFAPRSGFLPPSLKTVLALALWAGAWLVLLAAMSFSPPVDNAEQLSWVRSLEWGYYKHPPLPTMLLWPWVQAFGLHQWVAELLAAATTCVGLLIGRHVLRELLGKHVADLATLGTLCIGYYTGRLNYYNHDVVLLPAVAAAAWCCWHAFEHRSRRAWIGLGVCIGLGALAKYQIALTVLSVGVYWAWQGGWRDALHRRGLIQAALLAGLVFSPHVLWLVANDFQPLHYASHNSDSPGYFQCSVDALRWIGDQFTQILPALLLGGGLLAFTRRTARAGVGDVGAATAVDALVDAAQAARQARVSAFLFCFGVLPLLTMAVMGLMFGVRLHMNWATAFMTLTCGWLALRVGLARWQAVRWRPALIAFIAVQALLAAVDWASSARGVPAFDQRRSRDFASQRLADELGPAARAELDGPIRVIAGPQRLASVLALRLPDRPLVLIDGRYEISPWIPSDLASRCGVLWVGGAEDPVPYDLDIHPLGPKLWWGVEPGSAEPGECGVARGGVAGQ